MREITFKFGSREKGWKYYTCTDIETDWDKQRGELYGLEGNMSYWTYPKEAINNGRKKPIELNNIPMGMDFARCNYKKLCKKIDNITRHMKEENFDVEPEKTYYYWELSISNYEVSDFIGCIGVRHNKSLKMWRGSNCEPQGLKDLKECFNEYFKTKYLTA